MWLDVVGFIVSSMLGTSSFQKAIFFGRIWDLTVMLRLIPRYSSVSAVYWGQIVPTNVGLFGFLQSIERTKNSLTHSIKVIEYEYMQTLISRIRLETVSRFSAFRRMYCIVFELNLFQFATYRVDLEDPFRNYLKPLPLYSFI